MNRSNVDLFQPNLMLIYSINIIFFNILLLNVIIFTTFIVYTGFFISVELPQIISFPIIIGRVSITTSNDFVWATSLDVHLRLKRATS